MCELICTQNTAPIPIDEGTLIIFVPKVIESVFLKSRTRLNIITGSQDRIIL